MVVGDPCKICCQPAASNSDWIKCDKWDICANCKPNRINKQIYEYLRQDKSRWYCIVCIKKISTFSKLHEKNSILSFKDKKIKFVNVAQKWISEKTQFLRQTNRDSEGDENAIKENVLKVLMSTSYLQLHYL